MNDILELALRMAARRAGRAVPLASSSSLASDRGDSFGYAPIRIVSEERLQAVAFGPIDDEPLLTREALPMGRATAFLESLSDAFDEYLTRSIKAGTTRIYVPHAQAAETFWLLGERYENNPEASDKVKKLGFIGRTLAELMRIPGQQIVVNAGEALAKHVVSGGNKTQDLQLRYLLEWIDPKPGIDVYEAAENAALLPSAAMMRREDDDRVEHLRKALKRRKGAEAVRTMIEQVLDFNATSEWSLLLAARDAFASLALPHPPQLETIYDRDLDWLAHQLANQHAAPSRMFAMASLLEMHSSAMGDHDAAMIEGDARRFRIECETGRAAVAEVTGITRLGRGRSIKPLHMRVSVDQPLLRLRPNADVRFAASKLKATVLDITRPIAGGPYEVLLDVTDDLRNAKDIAVGSELRMISGQRVDMSFNQRNVMAAAREIDKPILTHDELPAATGRIDPRLDLTAILAALESRK